MTGKETKRLSKVAREFNVGISTIVDFLTKKGFEISSNPNNKISDEAYAMLKKEYNSDINLKKESEKLNLRTHRLKNESISIEDLKREGDVEAVESDEDEVMITDLSSKTRPEKTVPKKEPEKAPLSEEPHRPVIEETIKVVGKIDLENLKPKTAPVNEESAKTKPVKKEVIAEKPQKEEPKTPEVKPAVEPIAVSQTKTEEKKVEEKPAFVASESSVEKKETKPEQKSEVKIEQKPEPKHQHQHKVEPKSEQKQTQEPDHKSQKSVQPLTSSMPKNEVKPAHPVSQKDKQAHPHKKVVVEKEQVEEAEEKTPSVPEFIETNVPKIEDEIKVVGKIDLESLNQKTRPAKKSKKQKEEERRERIRTQREESTKAAHTEGQHATQDEAPKEDDLFTPGVTKLAPPVVVGKIDFLLQKKKPGAPGAPTSSSEESERAKKKHRKRIPKDKERVNVSPDGKPAAIKLATDASRKAGRKPTPASAADKKKRLIKKEVNEEDVQKQIKDTLARLTAKTKSKGSKYRREKRQAVSEKLAAEQERINEEKNILKVTEFVSVNELATMMDVQPTQVIATCMSLGMFVSINQRL
ncbi:MAG: translation initiation factor IF-2 N-terminal domain-containing protein, partial [Bacteroidota bacterium]|nr:translation initiation factor IF-2 N-terminal domain-containing protein [Bacteroidota bacterium]